jgi:hypothetical protein
LDASHITSETLQGTTSITVDPAQLVPCEHSSPNLWLTSEVVTGPLPKAVTVIKVTLAVQFVVTKQATAGLNLNIIPIAIGPQFSSENDKTQKICLLFNFDRTAEGVKAKPSCQSGSGSSGNNNQ